MSIAILGWGSLIWDPRQLGESIGTWLDDGPVLRIEFSRISSDHRLTLVLDESNGVEVATLYTLSTRLKLEEALSDLAHREGMVQTDRVGLVDRRNATSRSRSNYTAETVATWADQKGLSAVIWTDLPSNFAEKRRIRFSPETAAAYVSSLQGVERDAALEYIRRAPTQVDTPVRRLLREQGLA